MVCIPEWYQKQQYHHYTYPTHIKKCEILIIDTHMVLNKNVDTSPTLVSTIGTHFELLTL